MTDTPPDDWSPADHPEAIALSEAQWWGRAALLAVERMHAGDKAIGGFDTRQIDARHLCIALQQLLVAQRLQRLALGESAAGPEAALELSRARERFETAIPDAKHIRDGLTHFEDWSRGRGRGPQRDRTRAGATEREVARAFWSFGYDPAADTVSMGPLRIHVGAVEQAVHDMTRAIHTAARRIDLANAARVRDTARAALTAAGIGDIQVSVGADGGVWLRLPSGPGEPGRRDLAARAITEITAASLLLTSPSPPRHDDLAQRLAAGEPLRLHRA
ncbi:hypothetical protein [Streptomyces sp. CAU 1734]|uniref:hypothetical protein n=1 Tax=Streptomyces sp. CAU 1734 TaxID=3140360 RepID=UPI0032606CB8